MANYKLSNGNTIIAEADFIASHYPDATEVVAITAPVSLGTRITRLAFLSRITDAEAVAIDLASIGGTVQAASLRRFQKKVDNALFVDLALADTIAGINALVSLGFLTAPRAETILTTPATRDELPT